MKEKTIVYVAWKYANENGFTLTKLEAHWTVGDVSAVNHADLIRLCCTAEGADNPEGDFSNYEIATAWVIVAGQCVVLL